ncbi:hypothetical protein [Bacillus sp. MMSF_3328]|uniref:hypothetical protein n=1 Tax=Bacillus sp. MMSF_3328 TaxID=3047080 RepID=UPI00273E8357|nr:hypothetical protein [Bacillus sp. MMSF_3328]
MGKYNLDSGEVKYIPISEPIKVTFHGANIELWEIALVNLSLHRMINKVAIDLIEKEYGIEFFSERINPEYANKHILTHKIPRVIKTKVERVDNGSLIQYIQLLVIDLNDFATNQPFNASVLASLTATFISSLGNVVYKRYKGSKITPSKKLEKETIIDVGPNIRTLGNDLAKTGEPFTIDVEKRNDSEYRVTIEYGKKEGPEGKKED